MNIGRTLAASRRLDQVLKGQKMGKLAAIADRIRTTKQRLELEADKLGERLDVIDQKAPEAFARGHRFLDEQHAEVAAIEDTLRQLSNLPLDGSADLPPASPIEPPAPQQSAADNAPAPPNPPGYDGPDRGYVLSPEGKP